MRLLRPNVPPGISVWRQAPGGPITETAWVDRDRFVWCGLAEHPPPRSVEELAARPGREQYRGIFDSEKGDFSTGRVAALPERADRRRTHTAATADGLRLPERGYPGDDVRSGTRHGGS